MESPLGIIIVLHPTPREVFLSPLLVLFLMVSVCMTTFVSSFSRIGSASRRPLRSVCTAVIGLALLGGLVQSAGAQTDGVLQIGDPMHRFLEWQKTEGHLPGAFVSTQPLSTYEAHGYLDSLAAQADALDLSADERQWLARLRGERPEPGAAWAQSIWEPLYANGQDLAAVSGDGYALQLNPLLYASVGRGLRTQGDITTWRNTRGLRASGHVGPVFFETRITENQERPLVNEFQPAGDTAPRLGFVLQQDGNVYDYFTAEGMVGVRSKFFEVRLGRDRNRWGFGTGSLHLSNFPTAYEQLQVRTSVWRLQYTNLFTRFTRAVGLAPQGSRNDAIQPRSYGAFHRLAINVTDRFQLELFESIVFASEQDSTVAREGFDIAYLNPIIFYRAVERELGSPDNALVGLGGSWIFSPGWKAYGQFLLDELVVSEIGNQWWANKWGWVLGLHTTDLGIESLQARVEFARQRPYLYAHSYPPNAVVQYGDGLGHPAGPNSLDAALFLDYRPPGRWQAGLNLALTRRGRNTETQNFGADPTLDNDTRVRDRPVPLLQGVQQDRLLLEAHVGWEALPRLFVEGAIRAQVVDDEERGRVRRLNPYLTLRWGLPFESLRY